MSAVEDMRFKRIRICPGTHLIISMESTKMRDQKIHYVTGGRLWARGWNRYEAKTVKWLLAILVGAVVLGILAGVILAVLTELPLLASILIALFCAVVGLLIGIAVAKAVIPFVWDSLLTKDLGGGE